jgi:hypothetical protein
VALFAEEVPEDHREGAILQVKPDLGRAFGESLMQLVGRGTRGGDAGKIALHVGEEDGDPGSGKALGQDLQGHGLAGAGRARDQPVAVAVFQEKLLRQRVTLAAAAHENAVRHACLICHCRLTQPGGDVAVWPAPE